MPNSPSFGVMAGIQRLLHYGRAVFYSFRLIRLLMRDLGISIRIFFLPLLTSLGTAFFEGITVGLMVPVLQSIVQKDVPLPSLKLFDLFSIPFPPIWASRTRLLTYLVTLLFCASAFKVLFSFITDFLMTKREQKFQMTLRKRIFEELLNCGKAFYDRHEYGTLTTSIVNSVFELGVAFENVKGVIQSLLMASIYCGTLFIFSVPLTLVSLVIMPWLYAAVFFLIRQVGQISKQQWRQASEINQSISDSLQTVPLVKAYGMEQEEGRRFFEAASNLARVQFRATTTMHFMSNLQEIGSIAILVLLVFTANLLISHFDFRAGSQYLVFFYVLRRLFNSLNSITFNFARIARAQVYAERAREILSARGAEAVPSGKVLISQFQKSIEFRNLIFEYQKGQPVLNGLSFTVKKGEVVALVGASGAGKSTILHLLQRLYDVPVGTLFIDGVDVRDLQTKSLLDRFAIVSQEVFLFNKSIRYNLCYGLSRAPSELELKNVIKQAELETLMRRLPDGLDTKIGERGVRLSGGEKQRLSIARAILKNADILLLDEATSSLDTETEKSIQRTLDVLLKGRTSLVVAHRLSTIQHADRILVLEAGRLAESGDFNTLVQSQGRFHRLYEAQSFAA